VSIESDLLRILKNINNIKGVKGVMVVTREGLPVASFLPRNVDKLDFSAMNAALAGSAQTVMQSLNIKDGHPETIILEGKDAKLLYTSLQ